MKEPEVGRQIVVRNKAGAVFWGTLKGTTGEGALLVLVRQLRLGKRLEVLSTPELRGFLDVEILENADV